MEVTMDPAGPTFGRLPYFETDMVWSWLNDYHWVPGSSQWVHRDFLKPASLAPKSTPGKSNREPPLKLGLEQPSAHPKSAQTSLDKQGCSAPAAGRGGLSLALANTSASLSGFVHVCAKQLLFITSQAMCSLWNSQLCFTFVHFFFTMWRARLLNVAGRPMCPPLPGMSSQHFMLILHRVARCPPCSRQVHLLQRRPRPTARAHAYESERQTIQTLTLSGRTPAHPSSACSTRPRSSLKTCPGPTPTRPHPSGVPPKAHLKRA